MRTASRGDGQARLRNADGSGGTIFDAHLWEVPQQIRKSQDESKAAQKTQHKLLEEVAELQAEKLLQSAEERGGGKLVVQYFADRDLGFIKMLAQKLSKENAVALLACGGPQPSLVFAQMPGMAHDMGALMKDAVQALGTRGGGNRDMAQGGAPDGERAERAVLEAAKQIA